MLSGRRGSVGKVGVARLPGTGRHRSHRIDCRPACQGVGLCLLRERARAPIISFTMVCRSVRAGSLMLRSPSPFSKPGKPKTRVWPEVVPYSPIMSLMVIFTHTRSMKKTAVRANLLATPKTPCLRPHAIARGDAMKRQGDIAFRVESAKGDACAADQLVRDYLPFIKSEAAKFAGHPLQEGRDDELGIAMFAFHEAVLAYDESRGAFIPLASRAMRNRLIDYARRERRFDSVDSLDEPLSQDQDDAERMRVDALADQRDEIGERELRAASREEIAEFTSQLAGFGVELADVLRRAAGPLPLPATRPSCLNAWSNRRSCPSRRLLPVRAWIAKPSSATAGTWWRCCSLLPTVTRSFAATCAGSWARQEVALDEIPDYGSPAKLCGGT